MTLEQLAERHCAYGEHIPYSSYHYTFTLDQLRALVREIVGGPVATLENMDSTDVPLHALSVSLEDCEVKAPTFDQAEFEAMVEKGTKAWAGVNIDEVKAPETIYLPQGDNLRPSGADYTKPAPFDCTGEYLGEVK